MEFDACSLAALLQDVCQQQPTDVPIGLREFLHDLHSCTWYKLDHDGHQATLTSRGTRPGSPMADTGFNILYNVPSHASD